ncbi:hypothetical protein [Chryseolinea lacunae]|uniref:WYL domain-containing protein n=1 Tax=Chryseolinea lacunae TaxID=2801331 RepID=A0ABS1KR54_9BACT|nr:hypothetical protein [Chryseolinea lacunae]MBL0741924.1 hypothetical protein [Chryseolinea lacunae]
MPLPLYDTEKITRALHEAAQQKKVCSVRLFKETGARVIHPYGVCRTKHNKIVIVCWQEYGFSVKSTGPGYRTLLLLECVTVKTLDRRFFARNDFSPDDPLYAEWIFHI